MWQSTGVESVRLYSQVCGFVGKCAAVFHRHTPILPFSIRLLTLSRRLFFPHPQSAFIHGGRAPGAKSSSRVCLLTAAVLVSRTIPGAIRARLQATGVRVSACLSTSTCPLVLAATPSLETRPLVSSPSAFAALKCHRRLPCSTSRARAAGASGLAAVTMRDVLSDGVSRRSWSPARSLTAPASRANSHCSDPRASAAPTSTNCRDGARLRFPAAEDNCVNSPIFRGPRRPENIFTKPSGTGAGRSMLQRPDMAARGMVVSEGILQFVK